MLEDREGVDRITDPSHGTGDREQGRDQYRTGRDLALHDRHSTSKRAVETLLHGQNTPRRSLHGLLSLDARPLGSGGIELRPLRQLDGTRQGFLGLLLLFGGLAEVASGRFFRGSLRKPRGLGLLLDGLRRKPRRPSLLQFGLGHELSGARHIQERGIHRGGLRRKTFDGRFGLRRVEAEELGDHQRKKPSIVGRPEFSGGTKPRPLRSAARAFRSNSSRFVWERRRAVPEDCNSNDSWTSCW